MRAFAVLSTIAITASLAIVVPGSVAENTALASTPDTCELMHGTAEPALVDDSYVIDSVQKLVYLSVNQDSTWLGRNFVQTAPIDLEGCLWTPIGADDESSFTGEYDGGGFPIDNLAIGSVQHAGLLGFATGAKISNVVLRNISIETTGRAGAIAGTAFATTIRQSSATGNISASGDRAGGLVGGLQNEGLVENSGAHVAIDGGDYVGGLVGLLTIGSHIENSFARGDITGNKNVGGLVGTLGAPGSITNSYSTGEVSGSEDVGGLVGTTDSGSPTVTNSFWNVTTSGIGNQDDTTGSAGGMGKTTAQLRTIATFNDTDTVGLDAPPWPIVDGWDSFDPDEGKVWGILADLNGGYPYLLWEYETDPFACGPLVDGFHQVSTPEQLRAVGIRGEESPCGLGDNYRQMNNIDLADTGPWTPIGGIDFNAFQEVPFTGHYDGGDYTISNMSIESRGTSVDSPTDPTERFPEPVGFFGFLDRAKVERLTFDSASIGLSATPEPGARAAVPVSGILAGFVSQSDISQVTVSGEMSDLDFVSGGLVGVVFPGLSSPDNPTTITDCTVDVQMGSIEEAEITLGGVVGAVIQGGKLEVTRCAVDVKTVRPGEPVESGVSFANEPEFESILFVGEEVLDENGDEVVPGHPGLAAFIGGAVGGVGPGSDLTLDAVGIGAGSEIVAVQDVSEDDDSTVDFVAIGGLVGASFGTMTITNSVVGSPSRFLVDDDDDLALVGAMAESEVYLGGLVGLVSDEFVDPDDSRPAAKIVGSSAATGIYVFLPDGEAYVGGLGGLLVNTEVEQSVWDGFISGDTIDGLLVAGGVTGVLAGEDSFIRYSSSLGSIIVGYAGENDEPILVAGGLAGGAVFGAEVSDSWTLRPIIVDIGENPTFTDLYLEAGGAFGVVAEDSTVERVYSMAEVSITPSIQELQAMHDVGGVSVQAFAGSFAGRTSDVVLTANFVVEPFGDSPALPLVGDGPATGISELTEAELFSITAFEDAGWSIVTPATANTVPSGPEDEVWVMGNVGQCPPVLWWQWDMVKDGCFQTVTPGPQPDPETDPANPHTGDKDNSTSSSSASGSSRPGKTGSPAPSEDAGDNELPAFLRPFTPAPSTDDADLPEEPGEVADAETDAGADTAAGGDTATPGAASDNGAAAQSSPGLSTGALWAIGLGGVGAVALIAGGLAFARMRP